MIIYQIFIFVNSFSVQRAMMLISKRRRAERALHPEVRAMTELTPFPESKMFPQVWALAATVPSITSKTPLSSHIAQLNEI